MKSIIPQESIVSKIFMLRGQKVILDRDLSGLYGVETRILNQAVKRNPKRFPEEFMFQLNKEEFKNWKSQIVISNPSLKMAIRKPPFAFTEQGVAMLSSVLNSDKAIEINIQIMKAFVRLRSILSTNEALKYAIEGLERRMKKNERDIQVAINAIQNLLSLPESEKTGRKMGFTADK